MGEVFCQRLCSFIVKKPYECFIHHYSKLHGNYLHIFVFISTLISVMTITHLYIFLHCHYTYNLLEKKLCFPLNNTSSRKGLLRNCVTELLKVLRFKSHGISVTVALILYGGLCGAIHTLCTWTICGSHRNSPKLIFLWYFFFCLVDKLPYSCEKN